MLNLVKASKKRKQHIWLKDNLILGKTRTRTIGYRGRRIRRYGSQRFNCYYKNFNSFQQAKRRYFLDLIWNSRTVRKNRDREVLLRDRMLFPEQFTVLELNLVCYIITLTYFSDPKRQKDGQTSFYFCIIDIK